MIPAHPLALTAERKLDERRQRALTRYYLAAGAGGVAVGVHTTQFEIREHGLLAPVLELAMEEMRASDGDPNRGRRRQDAASGERSGIRGRARLSSRAAESRGAGVSVGAEEMLDHARAVARVIPLVGFYLQPAVGGRVLPYEFWREFAEIENVVAIKIAPFNRYQTIDVVRAVAESGRRRRDRALHRQRRQHRARSAHAVPLRRAGRVRIVGGLLGHWAVWTRRAVELLECIKQRRDTQGPLDARDRDHRLQRRVLRLR